MPRSPEAQRAYMREMRDRMRAAGLCVQCWMEEATHGEVCFPCKVKGAKASRDWWQRHKTPERLKAARDRMRAYRSSCSTRSDGATLST